MRDGRSGLVCARLSAVMCSESMVIESVGPGCAAVATESAGTVSAGICAEILPDANAPQSSEMMNM